MNHPVLVGVAMVVLSVVCYWGLMKLEGIKPEKGSKRRRAKRKRKKGRGERWKLLKRMGWLSRRDFFVILRYAALFGLLLGVCLEELLIIIATMWILSIATFQLRSLSATNSNDANKKQ